MIIQLLFVFGLILTTPIAHAQLAKKIVGPIQTRKGIILKEGDTLKLGRGSNYDGTFRYIKMGIEPEGQSNEFLPAHYAGKAFPIKLFRESQTGQSAKLFVSLKAHTLYTTFAEVEAAIGTKEIIAVNGHEIGKARPHSADNNLTASLAGEPQKKDATNSIVQDGMNVKQFSNSVNIKILSIEGNKSQQTVTVTFVLKTELPHQQVKLLEDCGISMAIREGKAYDGDGTEYNMKSLSLGNSISTYYVANKLPTSVPLKGSIKFANILPNVSSLSFITFYMSSQNYDGGANCQSGNVEIRNAKIDWK